MKLSYYKPATNIKLVKFFKIIRVCNSMILMDTLRIYRDLILNTIDALVTNVKDVENILGEKNGRKLKIIEKIYASIGELVKVKKPEKPERVGVGYKTSFTKKIEYSDVYMFSLISGDWNPIHHDEDYAKRTKFGKRVVHGMLTSSLISNALALIPGKVVLVEANMRYLKPVFIGDTVTAEAEIVDELPRGRYKVKTICKNQRNDVVVDGECVILIW